jgi:hypothetical protein
VPRTWTLLTKLVPPLVQDDTTLATSPPRVGVCVCDCVIVLRPSTVALFTSAIETLAERKTTPLSSRQEAVPGAPASPL